MSKKYILTLIIMAFFASEASATTGVTKRGFFACLNKNWFDNMTSFLVDKDEASMQSYVRTSKCITLKPGIKVSGIDRVGLGVVTFFYEGIQFWTMTEAIER